MSAPHATVAAWQYGGKLRKCRKGFHVRCPHAASSGDVYFCIYLEKGLLLSSYFVLFRESFPNSHLFDVPSPLERMIIISIEIIIVSTLSVKILRKCARHCLHLAIPVEVFPPTFRLLRYSRRRFEALECCVPLSYEGRSFMLPEDRGTTSCMRY